MNLLIEFLERKKMPITLKFQGKGFWSTILNDPSSLHDLIVPNRSFMTATGREYIRSYRGQKQLKPIVANGRISFSETNQYPTGIISRKSPNGIPFTRLSDRTMENREKKKKMGLDVSTNPNDILRETSRHILGKSKTVMQSVEFSPGRKSQIAAGSVIEGGLKITSKSRSNESSVTVGYIDKDNFELAKIHDEGFKIEKKNILGDVSVTTIPPRPIFGISKKFIENLSRLGSAWLSIVSGSK